MPSQHPLDTYIHWYRSKFGDRLNLSNLVGEENDEGNQDMDEGNKDIDEGSQDMDDDNEEQEPHCCRYHLQIRFHKNNLSSQARQSQYGHQTELMPDMYSLDARYPCHTSLVASGRFVSVDSSRSDGGRGVLNSQNPNRISMGLIEENANTLEQEIDAYLVDNPDDENDDEEDEIEEFDEDEESRSDDQAHTPDDKAKGYNLRIDPPRRSANRYTPSVFKKAAKKYKNFVKDVKWSMRK
nr:mitotic apparatus protein p62-like [Arachis hypogaea]